MQQRHACNERSSGLPKDEWLHQAGRDILLEIVVVV